MNAMLMWLFPVVYFGFFIWLVVAYGDKMLPLAASEHGAETDWLLNFNWVILLIAFVLTNVLLFYFAGKYVFSKDRRAAWYPHNNKLELIWTVIPAGVLAVIVIYGLNTWNNITGPASPNAVLVELYAKQFDWTARYPGQDGVMGASDFRLINGTNPLGIVTPESVKERLAEMEAEIAEMDSVLAHSVMPDEKAAELRDLLERSRRQQARVVNLRTVMEQDIKEKGEASIYLHGADDIVTKEFHLPVHKEVKMLIRSRDIIHSVYIPHLRAQMNAVPGMTTTIKMVPTITTDSMRTAVVMDDTFDFVVLCNKICGASHYNMQMPLTVTTADEYTAWMAEQMKKPFQASAAPAEVPANTVPADSTAAVPANAQAAVKTN
jgi:cytochrome c oxidase subunit 2